MRLTQQFQGQTVKGQGHRRAGAYYVSQTRWPHCLLFSDIPQTMQSNMKQCRVMMTALPHIKQPVKYHHQFECSAMNVANDAKFLPADRRTLFCTQIGNIYHESRHQLR